MIKRVILILTVFVVCAASSYFIFKPNTKSQTELALAHLKDNNYPAAEGALRPLTAQPMAYPLAIYKGYLEQVRGRYLESSLYFHTLLKDPPKNLKEAAMTEVLLAQAANLYFEQRDQEIASLIYAAHSLAPHNPFVFFFEGLQNYLRAEYGDALKAWNAFDPVETSEGTGWMKAVVEKLFPLSWRQLHIAHCLTEEGDVLTGREILEKESHQMGSQDLTQLATLFLGLTYLKEAEHIPLDQRGTYYKLARFYFERSGTKEQFQRERGLITPHVLREAEGLLLTDLDEEMQKWGFDFVHTLIDWKADRAIESLASKLSHQMLRQKSREDALLCQAIKQEFLGSPFHTLLTQKLIDAMADGLKQGDTDDLYAIWSMVERISPTPKLLTKEIASLTSEEIFRTVKRDTQTLVNTRRYLAFWEKLGRSSSERDLLAKELFKHAQLFWQQENQEKKGGRLMDIALKLCENKSGMETQIGYFLTQLYTRAEDSNLIGRLMLIFDAMDHFKINKQELATPSKLANHLADSEYLYHAHHYALAKAHALWVLKLDPENETAQRLVGLSSFHLGEYNSALCSLKKLGNPDEDARKALMLAQVFASQEQEKHLAQIDNIDSFEEDK